MDVTQAIHTKKAVRMFTDEPIPTAVIEELLDTARHSQSAKNTQPWQFVVVQDRATLEALSKTGDYAGHLAGATFGVVLVSRERGFWVGFDLGQLAAYLQLAAWEKGIGSCIASIYHPDQAKQILGVPEEMECHIALSFGYPSPEHKTAKMGGRKPVDDITHWDKW